MSVWAPSATCLLVMIQPFESKMTPEPTPDSGMLKNGSLGFWAAPVTEIVTIAGETFSAARVIAELSSIATGWAWVVWLPCPTGVTVATTRWSAPVASRMP